MYACGRGLRLQRRRRLGRGNHHQVRQIRPRRRLAVGPDGADPDGHFLSGPFRGGNLESHRTVDDGRARDGLGAAGPIAARRADPHIEFQRGANRDPLGGLVRQRELHDEARGALRRRQARHARRNVGQRRQRRPDVPAAAGEQGRRGQGGKNQTHEKPG